jgi:di/tripeptidase
VYGPGVGDNGLGLAVMTSLPAILEHLELELDANLVLMGSARSLGRGNIEGLRFFLSNTDVPIEAGICVEGVKLGRLSYSSIGMMRCEISYTVPEEYDWTQFGAVGSIVVINDVINRILEIPLPKRPRTSIMLGSVRGGTTFDKMATTAVLRFEIRSESGDMVRELRDQIDHIVAEVSSDTGAEVSFDVFAQRRPGGIPFAHPFAKNAMEIIRALDIRPRISPSTSELSALIDKQIPALTIGLTDGENMTQPGESILIDPIYKGISQLLGLILAIDKGYCDATE